MRRSASTLALALLLATSASVLLVRPSQATPSPLSVPPAVLVVGIWNDPASAVEWGVWAAVQLVRLLQFVDEGFDHLKDDVRRAIEHPQQAPVVVPDGPSIPPDLQPVPLRNTPRRLIQPAPIPDSLPLRSIS